MTSLFDAARACRDAADPAETVTVSFSFSNTGDGTTSNVVATLLVTNGVVSPSGSQSYGILPPGGPPLSNSFSFTISISRRSSKPQKTE